MYVSGKCSHAIIFFFFFYCEVSVSGLFFYLVTSGAGRESKAKIL